MRELRGELLEYRKANANPQGALMVENIMSTSRMQSELYAPTAFWREASQELEQDLVADRISRFRGLPLPQGFFVPTYGPPGNGLSASQIESLEELKTDATHKQEAIISNWVSGRTQADADFRVFSAAAAKSAPHLLEFSESSVGDPSEHFEFDGKMHSRSSLNYLLGLSFLAQYADLRDITSVVEIGGGFGSLGEIVATTATGCDFHYVDFDIPPTCFFAEYYLKRAVSGGEVLGPEAGVSRGGQLHLRDLPPISVLANWQIEDFHAEIDLFVNFISFQEMEPVVVENYLRHVARLRPRWVLLRNLREGQKTLSAENSVGVQEPVRGDFYAKNLPSYRLVAQDANVFGFKTADGFHSELSVFERVD